jgi:hypothetical protein
VKLAQRYRYEKYDHSPVWLEFDPLFQCLFCEEPVRHLSMGGPAICPRCDCGPWKTYAEAAAAIMRARRRLDEMPFDEAWSIYERRTKA